MGLKRPLTIECLGCGRWMLLWEGRQSMGGHRWEGSNVTVSCGLLLGYKILRWDDYMVSGLIVNKMRNQEIVMQQRKKV